MASKPTTTPRWADNGGAIVNPTSGKKDVGFVPTEKPPAEFVNWKWNLDFQWLEYLKDGALEGNHSVAGDLAVNGVLTVNGLLTADAVGPLHVATISSTGMVANEDDWAPAGIDTASLVRLAATSPIIISGIAAGQTHGRLLILSLLGGSSNITLADNSGASAAGNRFTCPGNVDAVIGAGGGALLYWDDAIGGFWRFIART